MPIHACYRLLDGKLIRSPAADATCPVVIRDDLPGLPGLPPAAVEWLESEARRASSSRVEFAGEWLFGLISAPDHGHLLRRKNAFAFLWGPDRLLILEEQGRAEALMDQIASQKHRFSNLGDVLLTLLERLLFDDLYFLYDFEEHMEKLETQVLTGREKGVNEALLGFKKQLIVLHSYYEQLIALGDRMEEEECFDESCSRQLHTFLDKAGRLDSRVESLMEYCAQIRESFHSETDLRMNRIMKTLTVITALFMPVTVISAWYGMNFPNMPELHAPHGYLAAVAVTLLLTVGAVLFCRHKKIL